MIAKLEFDLPIDEELFEDAIKGGDYKDILLCTIKRLENLLKYDEDTDGMFCALSDVIDETKNDLLTLGLKK